MYGSEGVKKKKQARSTKIPSTTLELEAFRTFRLSYYAYSIVNIDHHQLFGSKI